jgi:hypothetical protein
MLVSGLIPSVRKLEDPRFRSHGSEISMSVIRSMAIVAEDHAVIKAA